MRRLNLLLIAILLISGSAMAQCPYGQNCNGITPELKAQYITDDMVRKYSLDDKQAKELLAVNLEFTKHLFNYRSQSKVERKRRHGEMRSARIERQARLREILGREQYANFEREESNEEDQEKYEEQRYKEEEQKYKDEKQRYKDQEQEDRDKRKQEIKDEKQRYKDEKQRYKDQEQENKDKRKQEIKDKKQKYKDEKQRYKDEKQENKYRKHM